MSDTTFLTTHYCDKKDILITLSHRFLLSKVSYALLRDYLKMHARFIEWGFGLRLELVFVTDPAASKTLLALKVVENDPKIISICVSLHRWNILDFGY